MVPFSFFPRMGRCPLMVSIIISFVNFFYNVRKNEVRKDHYMKRPPASEIFTFYRCFWEKELSLSLRVIYYSMILQRTVLNGHIKKKKNPLFFFLQGKSKNIACLYPDHRDTGVCVLRNCSL